jgi:hypothetical protein
MITRKEIAGYLLSYMQHKISLAALIDWVETKIMAGNFEPGYETHVRTALEKLAAADATGWPFVGGLRAINELPGLYC